MELFIFCSVFIVLLIGLICYLPQKNNIITDSGYLVGQPNPYYFSGNKQQRIKHSNMLRISKIKRK